MDALEQVDTVKYPIKLFKSQAIALRELAPFIRNPQHLQVGRPFERLGGMRSREALEMTPRSPDPRNLSRYQDRSHADARRPLCP